jgi:hypothetical protein
MIKEKRQRMEVY